MNARRSSFLSPWFDLTRATLRATEKLGKAAGKAAQKQAPALKRSARTLFSGVATPTPSPTTRGPGRWEEGHWGLGPLAMRRYRLFIPPGTGLRRPAPLLVLLHGCGQDAASFAAATRAEANARAGGFAVLLPEQSSEANLQRCWNWFRPEPVVALETGILVALVEHVCRSFPLRRDRVFALGLSAGGAMALTLALRHPELLIGVGTHSGAVPGSAETPLQAGQAMRGRRSPEVERWRQRLAGRALPPLVVIHGDADRTVAGANAEASADLWLDLALPGTVKPRGARQGRLGNRHPYTITDWSRSGSPYVRDIRIAGLGHAWSGGTARQAFSDPKGPDALKLAWRFFLKCAE